MKKKQRIIGVLAYIACVVVGNIKFGWGGSLLCLAAWISACIFCDGYEANTDEEEPEHDSCDGCKHDLGGGHCKINVEGECREGGGFELWEGEDDA